MSRCEIVGNVVVEGSWSGTLMVPNPSSGARVAYECRTHGMPVASMHLPGSELCPIGRIEAATEAALAKIEKAKEHG